MKRKWMAAAGIMIMVALLTACSSKTAGGAGNQGTSSSANEVLDAQTTSSTGEAAGAEEGESRDSRTEGAGPQKESGSAAVPEAGPAVSFETTDLAGNPVNSGDLFSQHQLTMVNIWGTFCGPCLMEMPELEKLNYRLKQKDCAIVGIVSDVAGSADSETIGEANEIIEDIGVKYLNLIPWEDVWDIFPAQFIPTTYFVDAEGRIIGEPVVGANSADAYEEQIDAVLAAMQ